jgi:transcriptional regulator GlxA family with amidase domain
VLRRANFEQDGINFRVRYVAASRSISTSIGIDLHRAEPLPSSLPDDVVLIVIGDVEKASDWGDVTDYEGDAQDEIALVRWLRDIVRPVHTVIAICSGALLLGRAGLLDGRRCTTHYLDWGRLAQAAPQANVLTDRLYVRDGNVYTSAGVTAGIDLMLYFISGVVGHRCTVAVARYLVVYLRRSGSDSQVSPWLEGRNHIHPAVHRVQDAIAANPSERWTRSQLAQVAGASGRHLSRLFHEHVGMPIAEYRNGLRVAVARELLLQSELDMENIAERAGFSSTRQLRRAWQRVYRSSPSEIRSSSNAALQNIPGSAR